MEVQAPAAITDNEENSDEPKAVLDASDKSQTFFYPQEAVWLNFNCSPSLFINILCSHATLSTE